MHWDFINVSGPHGGVTEGPAWDGEALLFTHIPASRILRYDPLTRLTTVFRENTNHANGLMFDKQGRLFGCEGGGRRIVRYEPDGKTTVIVEKFEGKRLNMPNDLAIDDKGRIWFTDPWYEGAAGPQSLDRSRMELDHESVYRLDPQKDGTWKIARATFDTTRPNGLLFSLDHKTLFVAQSGRKPEEKRQLRAYPVKPDGSLGTMKVLHEFGEWRGIDGMVLDTDGNIVATAGQVEGGPGPSIYVFAPDGTVIQRYPMSVDRPTNCSFGGPGLRTLYVTTIDGFLFRVNTERQGRIWFPPLK
ncbi:MAG: SMP-30/gluconolactonase/LRE family protein [SAR202 cluster bacterium]|nr:SMP-30/gluconolactonase/LRE family protein [SAR202 cluster bacterium]